MLEGSTATRPRTNSGSRIVLSTSAWPLEGMPPAAQNPVAAEEDVLSATSDQQLASLTASKTRELRKALGDAVALLTKAAAECKCGACGSLDSEIRRLEKLLAPQPPAAAKPPVYPSGVSFHSQADSASQPAKSAGKEATPSTKDKEPSSGSVPHNGSSSLPALPPLTCASAAPTQTTAVAPASAQQPQQQQQQPSAPFPHEPSCPRLPGTGRRNSSISLERAELTKYIHLTQEATAIAKALGRDGEFTPRVFNDRHTGEDVIEVNFRTRLTNHFWPWDKFEARLEVMRGLHRQWQQCQKDGTGFDASINDEDDPFFDTEYQLVGEGDVWLSSLGNMVESSVCCAILNPAGECQGEISVSISPLGRDGSEGPWEDDDNDPFVDTPEELLDTDISFRIRITQVKFTPDKQTPSGNCIYDNTWVRYKFQLADESEPWSSTETYNSPALAPTYDYAKTHTVRVTSEVLQHLRDGKMPFEVWAHRTAVKKELFRRKSLLVMRLQHASHEMARSIAAAEVSKLVMAPVGEDIASDSLSEPSTPHTKTYIDGLSE